MIRRLWLVFSVLGLLYCGILLRLFYWMVLQSQTLRVRAATQYSEKVKLRPNRGSILSSDGSPLVVNQPSYLVFAEPNHISDKLSFARQVAPVISQPEEKILELLNIPDRQWVSLAKRVTNYDKERLSQLSLKGLGFEETSMRFYPEASMAAHVLGFVGSDTNGNERGYFGLEGYYNEELSGKDGSVKQERNPKGVPILISEEKRVEPEDGRTLVLWLDRSIQFILEKRLSEGIKKYGAASGIAVVMNPKTGGVLGMASYPNYDPLHYSDFDQDLYQNPAVASSYEPGSTFKPLVVAGAINERLLNANTTFNEGGPVTIGEYTIRTWDDKYHGTMTMTDILRYSSNVGMVYIQRMLGKDTLLRYIHEYGFGEKTNIDLEEESSPELRPTHAWTEIDYATSSFGQGIAATPLQVVRAISAIANSGTLMEPKLVKEFHDGSGKIIKQKETQVRQVITKQSAKEITEMMVAAVKYGEAKWAAPKGYRIAGKTGTAQIPVQGHYDETKTIASFVGFAPADDPKFVMLVILREPQTSQWGSETAAPVFFQIAKDMFSYLGIPPAN